MALGGCDGVGGRAEDTLSGTMVCMPGTPNSEMWIPDGDDSDALADEHARMFIEGLIADGAVWVDESGTEHREGEADAGESDSGKADDPQSE